jgi:AraC-like DNA-binding protein
MEPTVARYREFAPSPALRPYVYALFSFAPETDGPADPNRRVLRERAFTNGRFCSPQFADAHGSIVFELGRTCHADGRWRANTADPCGTVIGPLLRVGRTDGSERNEMVGAYFKPCRGAAVAACAASELVNASIDAWDADGHRLAVELCELDERARVDCLEAALLRRVDVSRQMTRTVDLEGLALTVLRRRGRVVVDDLARAAGVSRQHVSRLFRDALGVAPKLYARLARFQAALAYTRQRGQVNWAQAALDAGYADQSHMIAEFREFSSLTPCELANGDWFHPFIDRAASSYGHNHCTIPPSHLPRNS